MLYFCLCFVFSFFFFNRGPASFKEVDRSRLTADTAMTRSLIVKIAGIARDRQNAPFLCTIVFMFLRPCRVRQDLSAVEVKDGWFKIVSTFLDSYYKTARAIVSFSLLRSLALAICIQFLILILRSLLCKIVENCSVLSLQVHDDIYTSRQADIAITAHLSCIQKIV